ncbi:PPR3C phosphatase, partial [Nothocercus julius]|nr:PPR3C phosphatase [Nothocercus julius]
VPVDLAVRLCLSHSPPIRKLLNSYEELRGGRARKPLRSCLNQKPSVEPEPEWRESAKSSKGQKKKRVVFADMKGFSLTAVRFFSKIEEDLCDLQHVLSDLAGFRSRPRDPQPCRYVLDFSQPPVDYVAFRSRLHSNLVCLENCLIQDRVLSGTVKVRNIEYEKKVLVRVTFDGWRSFRDVPCQYLHSPYSPADTDTFSFALTLPKPSSHRRAIEFCISFQCGQATHWDNNHGRNYRVCVAGAACAPSPASRTASLVLSHRQHLGGPYW